LSENEVAGMYHALKRRWGLSGIGTGVYQTGVIGGPE
jgi:hypothetical protein